MYAVILAAGKGTRMGELSKETPKPMLKVLGKTLLEHKLDLLPDEITEVIIVVGHLQDKITEVLKDSYGNRKITYVTQGEIKGTAHALFACKEILKNETKFLVLNGDDIYSHDDMKECLKYDYSMLIRETNSIKDRAKVVFDEEGHIKDILEKYPHEEIGFVNTGLYVMTPKIFDYQMVGILNNEFGLPQTFLLMKDEIKIKVVQSRFWLQITAPEDLEMAETFLKID